MNLPSPVQFTSDEIYRNIPTAYPRKHLFDEVVNSGADFDELLDIANLTSGIEHERSVSMNAKDTWYRYGDLEGLDFCFRAVNIPITRFSDGSFPVWYGTFEEPTSIKEIEYHLCRQAAFDLQSEDEQATVVFERAMCRGKVALENAFDVSTLYGSFSGLLSNDYVFCNQVGVNAKSVGDGIIYLSVRNPPGKCLAIFDKNKILESNVISFYRFIINKSGRLLSTNLIDLSEGEV